MRTYATRERVLLGIVVFGIWGPGLAFETYWLLVHSQSRWVDQLLWLIPAWGVLAVLGQIVVRGHTTAYWERPVFGTRAKKVDASE